MAGFESGRFDELDPVERMFVALPFRHAEDVEMQKRGVALAVADALKARGVPYVFATGYGERGLPDAHRGHAVLQKPFQQDALEKALNTMLAG